MKEEGKFKVGDITNKGVVDKIYSYKDISINGELYDLSKHNIKLSKEGQTQEPVGGMLEIAKTIILSIDHYREAGRDDKFNVQSIADYLKRCFAPPSPVGIDVEALKKEYNKWFFAQSPYWPTPDLCLDWFIKNISLSESSTEEEKEL